MLVVIINKGSISLLQNSLEEIKIIKLSKNEEGLVQILEILIKFYLVGVEGQLNPSFEINLFGRNFLKKDFLTPSLSIALEKNFTKVIDLLLELEVSLK